MSSSRNRRKEQDLFGQVDSTSGALPLFIEPMLKMRETLLISQTSLGCFDAFSPLKLVASSREVPRER